MAEVPSPLIVNTCYGHTSANRHTGQTKKVAKRKANQRFCLICEMKKATTTNSWRQTTAAWFYFSDESWNAVIETCLDNYVMGNHVWTVLSQHDFLCCHNSEKKVTDIMFLSSKQWTCQLLSDQQQSFLKNTYSYHGSVSLHAKRNVKVPQWDLRQTFIKTCCCSSFH